MKYNKLLVLCCLVCMLCVSCWKDHYDVDNVNGVNAQGEVLLPIAKGSFSMMKMMQRFEIDSLLTFTASGDMSFGYEYDHKGAVSGSELLRFKDWEYEAHFEEEIPHGRLLELTDTVSFSMAQTITFEADHIHVISALMKSGHFEFDLSSNLSVLGEVVITTSDIKDAQGRDFRFVYQPQTGHTGFDLEGLHYQTSEPNELDLNYEFNVIVQGFSSPEIEIDVHILASDLAIQEMSGYVDEYDSRNRTDTTLILFPDNLSGSMEINGVRMRLSERNTFGLDARLMIDTAMVFGDAIASYSIFDPLPVVVELPSQNIFGEVFNQSLNGRLDATGGNVMASSLFTVKAMGMNEMVTVTDTSSIDVHVDVDIPFAFSIDDVRYLDTVDLNLSEINMPDMIEKLTLELSFSSTIPLNLSGQFFMYDSHNERITDTLLADSQLISASFDGQPTTTTICIEVTEDRIGKVMYSDRIIMLYKVDTNARNVVINANQKLEMFTKAKVKYNGVVEFGN